VLDGGVASAGPGNDKLTKNRSMLFGSPVPGNKDAGRAAITLPPTMRHITRAMQPMLRTADQLRYSLED